MPAPLATEALRFVRAVPGWALIVALATPAAAGPTVAADPKQDLFGRVFGDAARLDPDLIRRALELPEGGRLGVDRDGDGVSDACAFIDHSARHEERVRPLFVLAIDEDGDLGPALQVDLDSDLYLADWAADGTLDAAIDYQDDDGDDDVDQMALFYDRPTDPYLGGPTLRVWWSRDDGDDDRLMDHINYTYQQRDCQWTSHFSGDETLVAFGLAAGADRWVPLWENPFHFFDPDGDGDSEVVVRYQGVGDRVEALRFSLDADGDAGGDRTHDYDVSVSGIAPGSRWLRDDRAAGSDLTMPAEVLESITLRGIPTGGFIRRSASRDWAIAAPWDRHLLPWDEIDANTAGDWRAEPFERWEGVIAHPSEHFPQIGGPTCGPVNKRNEVAVGHRGPIRLYWHDADRRLHLFGASEGWLDVDFDLDGRLDLRYAYEDEDEDGYFDVRRADLDGDGTFELAWPMPASGRRDVPMAHDAVLDAHSAGLDSSLAESQEFIDAARSALGDPTPDAAEVAHREAPRLWPGAPWIGEHDRDGLAGTRFYRDLARDRLFGTLRARLGGEDGWADVEAPYAAGSFVEAARGLRAMADRPR